MSSSALIWTKVILKIFALICKKVGEKHIDSNNNESYDNYIKRILNNRENKKDKYNYQEKHHIIPKTMGGTNDSSNLIYLYAQEHYYAHKLLA